MTHEELEKAMKEIVTQWGMLHPDYELVILSLPKKDALQRKESISMLAEFLERESFE